MRDVPHRQFGSERVIHSLRMADFLCPCDIHELKALGFGVELCSGALRSDFRKDVFLYHEKLQLE